MTEIPYWLKEFHEETEVIGRQTAAIRAETENLRQQNASLRALRELNRDPDKVKRIVDASIMTPKNELVQDKSDTLLVANWFIGAAKQDGQQITLPKLQKLVYFAYGWHLALCSKPLISEVVTVWPWGPGFQSIYDFAGEFGSEPIPSCLSLLDGYPTLREDDPRIPLLRRIWGIYGEYSPPQLAQMVNETDGPWDKTRRKHPDRASVNIDDDLIMSDFKSKMQDSSTTLKPCPHCGSTNLRGPHITEYVGDTYAPTWWVECEECPASMEVDGETPEPLIAAWNRRPILRQPQ